MTHKKILEGILDKSTDVVVKIADKSEDIQREYDMYSQLVHHRIQGIVHYYCYFECNDDLRQSDTLCQGPGDSMRVLVMEYIRNKSFALHRWRSSSIEAIKSVIKQTLCISLDAYVKFGFVHGDLHCNNILLKRTESVSPLIFEFPEINHKISIDLHGFKAKLMDFEFSKTQQPVQAFFKDLLLNLGTSLLRYMTENVRTPIKLNEIYNSLLWMKEHASCKADAYKIIDLLPIIDSLT